MGTKDKETTQTVQAVCRAYLSRGVERRAAYEKAVKYCIRHNILREFLRKNRAERQSGDREAVRRAAVFRVSPAARISRHLRNNMV